MSKIRLSIGRDAMHLGGLTNEDAESLRGVFRDLFRGVFRGVSLSHSLFFLT